MTKHHKSYCFVHKSCYIVSDDICRSQGSLVYIYLLALGKVTNDKDTSHHWKEKQVRSLNSLKFERDKDKVVSNSRYG